MTKKPPKISPTLVEELFSKLAELVNDEFNFLKSEVAGESAFDRTTDRLETIAEKVSFDTDELRDLLTALSYIYRRLRDAETEQSETRSVVLEFLRGFKDPKWTDEQREKIAARLAELLAPNENAEAYDKSQRLKKGFLDNAVSFATFVDLRPDFNKDKSVIKQFVPVVQLKVFTDSEKPGQKSLVFQLDKAALAKLKKELDDLDKKLETVRSGAFASAPIYKR